MLDPTLFTNGAPTGAMGWDGVDALQKALDAGYGTDMTQLTGGAALRIQSLDKTMQAMIQENQDFVLFNKLAKTKPTATVDEWTEQSSVGGFIGGSSNTEDGPISQSTGSYARRVGLVKYLTTMRQVSFVQTLQGAITDSEAVEYHAGAMQLLTDAEHYCFEGDSTVVPTEYDGIYAQIASGVTAGRVDNGNIIDARGAALDNVALVNQAAAQIRKYPNFGRPTDIFLSLLCQADFDTNLDPAFRVPLPGLGAGGISIGAPVVGIRTSHGNITNCPDIFVADEEMQTPFEVRYPATATAQASIAPNSVAAAAASNASSQFTAAQAGNYYYLVAGVNMQGQSTGVVTSQVAVAAGQGVTLTITRSTGAQETGYVIYRSRLNGGNVVSGLADVQSDFRKITRIPSAGATTTYLDLNADIPGTTKAYVLNMVPGMTAITWRQLLPMLKFPLYPTNSAIVPWAQLLFGYLRISKPRQHVVIKNIVTNGQAWRPFN